MTDFGYITDPSLNCLSFTQAFRCSTRHRLLIFHNSKDTGYFISKFFMQFLVHLLLDSTLLTKELIYEAKWTSHLCSSRFDVSKYLTTGRYFYKVRVFFVMWKQDSHWSQMSNIEIYLCNLGVLYYHLPILGQDFLKWTANWYLDNLN